MKQGKTDAEDLIKKYMEDRANLLSKLAVYDETMRQMREENADLKKKSRISVNERLEMGKRKQEYEQLKSLVSNIPPEILKMYSAMSRETKPHSLERWQKSKTKKWGDKPIFAMILQLNIWAYRAEQK